MPPTRDLPHGFLAHRLSVASDVAILTRLERNKDMLSRCLNLRTTVAVVGAGCSNPLGYPLWAGFVAAVLEQAADHPAVKALSGKEGAKKRRELDRLRPKRPDEYAYVLGWVQQLIESAQQRAEEKGESFHQMISGNFHPEKADRSRLEESPYEALLDLPIRRFVTTNNDTEIEEAIIRRFGTEREMFAIGETPRATALSLTQESEYVQQLTRFALARQSANDRMVFHCHGRWDRPSSMVASEEDYQKWYLTPRFDGLAFRHSIELLFSSNPLLFVGYGLGDEDLLRPLRVLSARDAARKESRPIFALMELDPRNPRDLWRAGALYDRFGVQVVPFDRKKQPDRGLGDALRGVRERWTEARREWSHKPPPRSAFPFCQPGAPDGGANGIHANMDVSSPIEVPKSELEGLGAEIRAARRRVIGLIGPAGSSKSWHAVEQVKRFARPGETTFPGGIFYWNAHYANEVMTTLDRMGRYLTGDWRPEAGTILERLREALRDRECLIVIDGCERFMRPTDRPFIGDPIDRSAARLFDLLSDPDHNQATILLVGRLWPSVFEPSRGSLPEAGGAAHAEADAAGRATLTANGDAVELQTSSVAESTASAAPLRKESHVITIPLDSIHKRQAVAHLRSRAEKAERESGQVEDPTVLEIIEQELSGLCMLLEGHNFSLHLAIELLRKTPSNEVADQAKELRDDLAGVRPDRRRALIVEKVLERLAEPTAGLAEPLLRLMTTSLNALSASAVELCLELAEKERKRDPQNPYRGEDRPTLDVVLAEVEKYGLLVKMPRVTPGGDGKTRDTHTVHASLRGYFFDRRRPSQEELPSFALGGLVAGGKDDGRRRSGFESARELIQRLVSRAESLVVRARGNGVSPAAARAREDAIDLCRDAFGVLRARMDAVTVPRWGRFGDYTAQGARLIHLAKSIGHLQGQNWGQLDSEDLPGVEAPDAPLYLSELAWLYNDMAVALALEGALDDAVPTLVLAQDFARMLEPTGEGGPYRIQILLNLSHTMIERGQLREAERYLTRASHMNVGHGDRDLAARIDGYRAHLDHLRGNLKDASDRYAHAIKELKQVGNVRARSYFFRLWGLLLIHRARLNPAQLDEAVLHLNAARTLAGEGDYRDLEIEARIARGVLHQAFDDLASARLELNAALGMAKKIGSRRLEAEAFCRLARVAKRQGDLEGASRNATRSIQIANECGLSLRRTHGLLVLGLATVEAGDLDLGLAYLRQASRLADRQQYWIRQREAEEELQRLEAGRSRATRHSKGIRDRRAAL